MFIIVQVRWEVETHEKQRRGRSSLLYKLDGKSKHMINRGEEDVHYCTS